MGERPRSGGEDGDVHRHPARCRSRHAEMGGLSPIHGLDGRIGVGAPLAVVQPQAPATCGTGRVHIRNAVLVHEHSDVGCARADRHRERPKPPPNPGLPLEHRQAPGRRPDASPTTRLPGGSHRPEPHIWRRRLLSASSPLRRSCSPSIERNRTMARTKRSRRSYGAGECGRNRVRVFSRSENRPIPDRVAGERSKAHPVAGAPGLETGEAAGG